MEGTQLKAWMRIGILLAIGFACTEAWPPTLHMAANVVSVPSVVASRPPHGLCAPSLVISTITCIGICLLGKRMGPILDRWLKPWLVGGCLALLVAFLAVPAVFPETRSALTGLEGLAIGASGVPLVLMYLHWLRALGTLPPQHMIFTLLVAQVFTCGVNAFLTSTSGYAVLAAALLMPIVSALCIRLVPDDGERNLEESITPFPKGSVFFVLLAKLAVVTLIFGGIDHLFKGEFDSLIRLAGERFALGYHVAAFVVSVALLGFLYVLAMRRERFQFGYLYRVMFLLGLASVLIVPLAWAGEGVEVGYACSLAMYQLVFLFVWSLCASVFRGRPTEGFRFFGVVYGCWSAGSFGGAAASMFMSGRLSSDSGLLIVAVAAIAIAVGYSTVFTESNANALVSILPMREKRPFMEKCLALAKRCGLSPRETEVTILIAQGRDSAHIQEKLCLSRSTVQTHRMHIYRKLDIHNRQELLDMIEHEQG